MPKKTNENKVQKDEKALVVEKPVKKKTTNKSSSNTKKTVVTSKKIATKIKKTTTVASEKKGTTSKKTTSKKKVAVETTSEKKNVEAPKVETKVKKNKEDIIKEETVIEKIKSFLSRIIAMQEEAKQEIEEKKAEKTVEKTKVVETNEEEKIKNTPYMLEYYDLPYRYNETLVKILAQTPKKLFVYWDISDYDREKYVKAFGDKFFEETYPVLLVHNEDMNYTFEVAINDFANSWYLDINDSKSKYVIELGRKFKAKSEIKNIIYTEETKNIVLHNDYVPIASSNILEVPNDHILFENVQTKLLYRNVKDNTETFIDIENNKYAKEMEHIYNIYDLYKEIYKNEIDDESLFDLLNPSSMSSSAFK